MQRAVSETKHFSYDLRFKKRWFSVANIEESPKDSYVLNRSSFSGKKRTFSQLNFLRNFWKESFEILSKNADRKMKELLTGGINQVS